MATDTYRHKGLRRRLVATLKAKGIGQPEVLEAIGKVPRHAFLDSAFLEHAYQDKAFPIGQKQTISQPYTVARQTELLQLKPNHKILEIGTGSGYQAAVLLEMGAIVYTIEYNSWLFSRTATLFKKLDYKAHLFEGDGSLGLPDYGPYNGILVTAASPSVPINLLSQLAVGGRLVIPVGDRKIQRMIAVYKGSDGKWYQEDHGSFSFVPLLGEKGWSD